MYLYIFVRCGCSAKLIGNARTRCSCSLFRITKFEFERLWRQTGHCGGASIRGVAARLCGPCARCPLPPPLARHQQSRSSELGAVAPDSGLTFISRAPARLDVPLPHFVASSAHAVLCQFPDLGKNFSAL